MARVVVIGLDGVPEELLRDLCARGVMPRLSATVAGGRLFRISSTYPPLSSVAWSTVLTGVGPAEHGIFGFAECDPRTYRYAFPFVDALKAPPLWQILGAAGKRCVFLNVPSTYPAPAVNGVLVSGFVAPSLRDAVWPRSLLPALEAEGYAVDVDARLGHGDTPAFLDALDRVLDGRMRLVRRVWGQETWDFFMLVFTGTDRLLHFLFDAWQDAAHPAHARFLAYFARLDAALGEVFDLLADDDVLIMLSDHGFGPLRREIYTNEVLRELGFLSLRAEAPTDLTSIAPESRALALDPGRIYLHTRERFARGQVRASDALLAEVAAGIEELCAARAIAGKVLRGRDIYAGPCAHAAPDLLVVGADGDDWKGRVGTGSVTGRQAFTGCHTLDNAFFLVRAARAIPLPETVELSTVAHCVRWHYGIGA